jgi:hypothetical protein
VGVSTGTYVGDVPFPLALFGGGLSEADEQVARDCYAKYE